MARAYRMLREELEAALYEEDPGGMGITVGAPLDEYAQEASRLATMLKGFPGVAEIVRALEQVVGSAPAPLVSRVLAASQRFEERLLARPA